MCALFERYKKIPEKPKEVYQKVIKLLLEEWDAQRDISRRSNYGNFDIERKSDFLSHLSFQLTKTHYKSIFSLGELEKSYIEICPNFNLPKKQCNEVVDELESHTGIFLQSGYDKYEFSHKSLQEYLTANYIVKLPSIPAENYIANMPSESALMVAISSNPTLFLGQFLFGTLSQIEFSPQFISSFF